MDTNTDLITRYPVSPVTVKAGDVYEWVDDTWTRSGVTMPKGSRLKVVEPTGQAPYGEIGPAGHNWLCDAANGYTVWATLELVISLGFLKKVSP